MTNVSELTREMISDYEAMVGRKLTPQEYLQFRNQAMIELQNGFMTTVSTSMCPPQSYIPFPQLMSQPIEPVQTPHSDASPIVTIASASENVAKKEVQDIAIKEPVHKVVTKEPEHEVVTVEIETPSSIEEDDEPVSSFFALIDRIEA